MATEPELESALHYLGLGYSTSPKSSAVDEPTSLYQIAHGLAVCPTRLQCVHAVSKHRCVHYFETPPRVTYYAYADDFGPYNLAGVITFGRHVRSLRENLGDGATLALCTGEAPRALANGLFLLGAFLVLDADIPPDEVHARVFARIDEADVESYRDILPTEATFRLQLIDCWRALARAKGLGWVSLKDGEGQICIDEYRHYDAPGNGDLHEVVPGKLVAFKGPRDLPGPDCWQDDARGVRHFHPRYYLDIFEELGVSDVVRLNAPEYDAAVYTEGGVAHHDIPLSDGRAPTLAGVHRFLAIVEAAPGLTAVHCQAGLGRTGVLIALYLMKHLSFTPREAIAWLRIARPGSVSGEQQDFLVHAASLMVK